MIWGKCEKNWVNLGHFSSLLDLTSVSGLKFILLVPDTCKNDDDEENEEPDMKLQYNGSRFVDIKNYEWWYSLNSVHYFHKDLPQSMYDNVDDIDIVWTCEECIIPFTFLFKNGLRYVQVHVQVEETWSCSKD